MPLHNRMSRNVGYMTDQPSTFQAIVCLGIVGLGDKKRSLAPSLP